MTSLLLYDTTLPALIHVILGTGLPVALQSSVTLSPSLTGVEHCWIVTVGGSGREIQYKENDVTLSQTKTKISHKEKD